jgi:hypothetical protein
MFVEMFNRAIYFSLLRNFEELLRTNHANPFSSALERHFESNPTEITQDNLSLELLVHDCPIAQERRIQFVNGLPFIVLAGFGLHYIMNSK